MSRCSRFPFPATSRPRAIARENFLLAAPRGCSARARRGKLTERDLEDQTVLLLEDGHCLRDQALAVCERGGAVESMEVRATSLPTLVQMVAGGIGVTLLPEAAAEALVQPRGPVEVARVRQAVRRAARSASRGGRRRRACASSACSPR